MKNFRWGTAVVALTFAATMALAGCSSAPSGESTGGGTSGDGQSGQTGTDDTTTQAPGDVNLDDYKGLPDTFPKSEVPIIEGEVVFGLDLGTGWTVVVANDDLAGAYAGASEKLKAAGFNPEVEQTSADGSVGVFTTDKYQINVTAADTPDYGKAVTYVVVLKG